MHPEILTYLFCPECGAAVDKEPCASAAQGSGLALEIFAEQEGDVLEGMISCRKCNNWYRIEQGVLDFLPLSLRRYDRYAAFAGRHGLELPKLNDTEKDRQKANQQNYFNEDTAEYEEKVVNSRFSQVYDRTAFIDWLERNAERIKGPVLEVGCGTGRQSIPMAQRGIHTLAGDISEEMLVLARKKVIAQGLGQFADMVVFDGENPPVRENSFSACIFYGVLHHMKDKGTVIGNASKKLMRGGLFYSLDPHKSLVRPVFDFLMRLWKIYHEEADEDPLLTSKKLTGWLADCGIECRTRLTFYLPPHLYNFISYESGIRLLQISDRCFNAIPGIRNFAGVIIAEGIKK